MNLTDLTTFFEKASGAAKRAAYWANHQEAAPPVFQLTSRDEAWSTARNPGVTTTANYPLWMMQGTTGLTQAMSSWGSPVVNTTNLLAGNGA